jgi:ribonuclease HI
MALITLFTDASFCSETCAAGWAAWFKCNGKTFRFAGKFKSPIETSYEAEVYGIGNGIFLIDKHLGPLSHNDLVIIQSDCLGAVQALGTLTKTKSKAITTVRDQMLAIKARARVRFDFRHVTGHEGTKTRRSAVNTWCDAEAFKFMKLHRQELAGSPSLQEASYG